MGTKMKESFYGQRRGSAPRATNASSSRPGQTSGIRRIAAALATASVAGLLGCATPTLEDRRELIREDPRKQARFQEGPPRRVMMISVAGLQASDYLDPFGHAAADGALVHMPSLARLAREGATGLAAMPPSPGAIRTSHATIVTGLSPARHGIIADSTLDDDGGRAIPFMDHRSFQGTPLWDAALGRGVVSLGWPTTSGARIERILPERNVAIAGDWLAQIRGGASPIVWQKLQALALAEREIISRENKERNPASWPNAQEKDSAIVEIACQFIAAERDAGLWLIRLDQTLPLFYGAGPGTVEADDALARVDTEIGRLQECLSVNNKLSDTAIFVVGDVAFHPVHTTVSPNVVLVRAGLVGRDPRSDTGVRSWLALARSHGRSAYVYARDATDALDARKVLMAEAERTGAFEVISAKRLAESGGDPQAWFALVAKPGVVFGDELVGSSSMPSILRGAAGVLRNGEATDADASVGFVAWGRGIRNGVRLPRVELIDVAPTIAALLGLRLDDEVQGKAILGILRSATKPPPPGPKRLGGDRSVDQRLRDLKKGRSLGNDAW